MPTGQREIEILEGWRCRHKNCLSQHHLFYQVEELMAHYRAEHSEAYVLYKDGNLSDRVKCLDCASKPIDNPVFKSPSSYEDSNEIDFDANGGFDQHVMKKHANASKFWPCSRCNYKFMSGKELENHLKQAHKMRLTSLEDWWTERESGSSRRR